MHDLARLLATLRVRPRGNLQVAAAARRSVRSAIGGLHRSQLLRTLDLDVYSAQGRRRRVHGVSGVREQQLRLHDERLHDRADLHLSGLPAAPEGSSYGVYRARRCAIRRRS